MQQKIARYGLGCFLCLLVALGSGIGCWLAAPAVQLSVPTWPVRGESVIVPVLCGMGFVLAVVFSSAMPMARWLLALLFTLYGVGFGYRFLFVLFSVFSTVQFLPVVLGFLPLWLALFAVTRRMRID